ncbi:MULTISPECIES: class II fructose-bisphosphate aldolase [Pantoea]|jgi:fructose-bisphosphate aldolase class II|uniref:class II fructose-bisphosphate aldolase n=1 Tax=Pantoea TaxID=53335 RepID=UPI000EA2B7BF|nr:MULTISPECIES: class II fructose-bisphosphate aldolase [Pantoea]MBZ6388371.1 class II fructose-bisphosphate aldolase family protein [Pantoea piersonii]MBZ6401043.1 class II fructose-bisphosphate aldolase family protein [Pantoea piersonii]MBZ6409982.1 class II fructose-bisphosphate aldolase family protein [Pantoea piersonii]MBZ6428787.1 class II fructose-bisphosphate aldolase family protein [Pantoea piersonii]NYB02074.1 class II fructose-bisphosphate aldolase family protein [Pantoea piersonii
MFAMMNDLIQAAFQHRYAVLAINCFNLETARAAIQAAEQQRAPLILNVYQGHSAHFPPTVAVPLVQALASNATVPVALALDHGKAFSLLCQAFRAGFTGLMIDASADPLADNIRQTAAVVRMAHTAGVCVEGELGHIADAPTYELADASVKMTQVQDVLPFIEQTDIDLLAISVGTAHGLYPPGVKPKIDFQRLQELHAVSTRPLALHGGSGTPAEDIRRVSEYGVAKINLGAAVFDAGKRAVQQALQQHPHAELADLLGLMESACREVVAEYLGWSGSANRA